MTKANHMLAILLLLQSRKKMTARQLADHLEIHIRSVYRYVDALCSSGVPIVSETGRDGGYYIPEGFKLEPLFFDAEEQKSLVQAAQFVRNSGLPVEEALNRAIVKIKRYASAEEFEKLEVQEKALDVVRPLMSTEVRATLQLIEQAIEETRTTELHYYADYREFPTTRWFDPYGIVSWKDKWYIAGYCHIRKDIRHFRVDRIARIRLADERFDRPAFFSPRESLLQSLLPASDGEGNDQLVSVWIEGSPQAMEDLCSHWLFAHTLVERTGSVAHFRIDEHNLYLQAPYYLLSFGGKIRVKLPLELRECLAEIAESLYEIYRSD